MENKIKMSFKNEDGKIIYKDVPENLASLYKLNGWEYVKETTPKSSISEVK